LGGAAAAEGQDAANALDVKGSSCVFGRVRSRPAKIIKSAKNAAYYLKTRCSPQNLARRLASPFFLAAGNRFARDNKEPGPSWGKQSPEERLRKPPRRDTRALSAVGMFGGKAPLRLAAQKNKLRAPSAPMRSAPVYVHYKRGV
jgi:hypothetical protein